MELCCGVIDSIGQHLLLAVILSASGGQRRQNPARLTEAWGS